MIVPTSETLANETSALRLARYAHLLGYSECQFWGVRREGDTRWACHDIWTKPERDNAEHYLAEAQEEIERVVGYPLGRRWITDEQHRWCRGLVNTSWNYVVEFGVSAVADIALAEPVDHSADPAVLGPVATTVTDPEEVHVFHEGTDLEVDPSAVEIAGGQVTVTIPRCRLVLPEFAANTRDGWDYTDTTATGVFAQTMDLKRVYNDPSVNATLVWPGGSSCPSGCGEETAAACAYVFNHRLGIVTLQRATWSNGEWVPGAAGCAHDAPFVRFNYRAGLPLTRQAEDAILRLAHAKMPEAPCGCDEIDKLWKRDHNIPGVLTRERINCPFGLNDGAWVAYRFAQAMRVVRAGVL